MKRTREEVAKTIDEFVNGTGRQWDWDGFTSIRLDDPELEKVRQKCVALPVEFPPTQPTDYCSPAGMEVMRKMLSDLRARRVTLRGKRLGSCERRLRPGGLTSQ
ncbi:MAG: hypothetical protein DLM73_00625 [Chthoniobacterales bacterium]|nr:MAG: hypothetical protein DLM73_00625 [Chthoniobacterales bacterium]